MNYRLRVSGSEGEEREGGEGREFEVKPKSGVLPPNYHQNIQVHMYVRVHVYTCTYNVCIYIIHAELGSTCSVFRIVPGLL